VKHIKKLILAGAILCCLLFASTGIYVLNNIDNYAELSIKKGIPPATGTPVGIKKATISPFCGTTELKNFNIGTTEGFKSKDSFKFNSLQIKINPTTVFDKQVHINEIIVDGAEVTFEISLKRKKDNLSIINSNIKKYLKKKKKKHPKKRKKKKKKKKSIGKMVMEHPVIIDNVLIKNAALNFTATEVKSPPFKLVLPEIILTDIGKKNSDVTLQDALSQIVNKIGSVSQKTALANKDLGRKLRKEFERQAKKKAISLLKKIGTVISKKH
jgi:hypothetical protein